MTRAAPLAPPDLDDGPGLLARDVRGGLRAAASAGAQVRAVAAAVADGELTRLTGSAPRSVVLLAAGGVPARAAELVVRWVAGAGAVPLVTGPELPRWVGALDTVVVLGDDAGDLVLAAGAARAVGRGADVVLVTPADGPLAAAGAGRAVLLPPRLPTSGPAGPGGTDGAGLPRFLAAVLAVLGAVAAVPAPDLGALADSLDEASVRDQPGSSVVTSPAKTLAATLAAGGAGGVVLAGAGPLGTALAALGAAALLRHAGVPAAAVELADALLAPQPTAQDRTDLLFHDPELDGPPAAAPPRVVVVAVGAERERLAPRTAALGGAALLVGVDEEDGPVRTDPAAVLLETVLVAARLEAAAVYVGLSR